jgi:ElaB/YqjD/DUF883 family membrane-anchored ribosome-binding protein
VNNSNEIEQLEVQARREREQLHASADDLRRKVRLTKEKMNPSTFVRDHIEVASGVAALIGLALGYTFSGLFYRE